MRYSVIIAISTIALVAACGITGSKYVDYQSVEDTAGVSSGGGGAQGAPQGPTFCQPANDSIGTAFTSAGCSCHGATPPTISGDSNADRLAFVNLAQTKYDSSYAEFVAYLKTDHAGASSVIGDAALALDDWVINETSICPGLAEEESGQ